MPGFDIEAIKGVIPALVTCFDENENVDEKRIRGVVSYLKRFEIGGLYITGSTGEGFLMSAEERKMVVETVVDEVKGKIPVIVHVGNIGTKLSADLALHAFNAGADAVSSVPPFYWKFSEDHIFNYYKDLSMATPLPMIVYNIALAGAVGFDLLKKLATISNVKGVKYTLPTHYDIPRIKDVIGGDFAVYSGVDEMAFSGISLGADGIIGSFYNLMPEIFIDIYDSIKNGDYAGAAVKQEIANKVIFAMIKYDYVSLIKMMLSKSGIDAGYCRKPFKNYAVDDIGELMIKLKEIKNEKAIDLIGFLKNI